MSRIQWNALELHLGMYGIQRTIAMETQKQHMGVHLKLICIRLESHSNQSEMLFESVVNPMEMQRQYISSALEKHCTRIRDALGNNVKMH